MPNRLMAMLLAVLLTLGNAWAEDGDPPYSQVTMSTQGYSLNIAWAAGLEVDDALTNKLFGLFMAKYPAIRESFGTTAERSFTLWLTNDLDEGSISRTTTGGAYVSYAYVTGSEKGMNHLISLFAQQVMGSVPNHDNNAEVHVLSSGLHAYAESVYADDPAQAVWLIPYQEGQQLTDGHQVAAAFLKWVADTYSALVPVRLNRVLHEGTYDSLGFWLNATGDTLGNLWNQYAASAAK